MSSSTLEKGQTDLIITCLMKPGEKRIPECKKNTNTLVTNLGFKKHTRGLTCRENEGNKLLISTNKMPNKTYSSHHRTGGGELLIKLNQTLDLRKIQTTSLQEATSVATRNPGTTTEHRLIEEATGDTTITPVDLIQTITIDRARTHHITQTDRETTHHITESGQADTRETVGRNEGQIETD